MSRLVKLLLLPAALIVAVAASACGTQRITAAKDTAQAAQGDTYHGAVLFNQRCSGCHTLSYAGARGSAPNIRDAQGNSGPNFDQRCERPIDRILYAIENGGFSGAYMPQNIVVGHDAVDVARFVATYSGRSAPKQAGLRPCSERPFGRLPANTEGLNASGTDQASSETSLTVHPGSDGLTAARAPRAKKHSS